MARWFGSQGQINMAKKAKSCPDYDVTHKKPQTHVKNF